MTNLVPAPNENPGLWQACELSWSKAAPVIFGGSTKYLKSPLCTVRIHLSWLLALSKVGMGFATTVLGRINGVFGRCSPEVNSINFLPGSFSNETCADLACFFPKQHGTQQSPRWPRVILFWGTPCRLPCQLAGRHGRKSRSPPSKLEKFCAEAKSSSHRFPTFFPPNHHMPLAWQKLPSTLGNLSSCHLAPVRWHRASLRPMVIKASKTYGDLMTNCAREPAKAVPNDNYTTFLP